MSEQQKCSKCGEPKPDNIHHLWACCGDGPCLAGEIRPEQLACVRRQLAAATAKLEAANAAASEWARAAESEVGAHNATKGKLEAAEGRLLDMAEDALEKLEAAEGRVVELEMQCEKALEHVTSCALDRAAFVDEELRAFSMIASRFKSLHEAGAFGRRRPAPEGAKPAEHTCSEDDDTRHCAACDKEYEREMAPASPPSPAQADPVLTGRCAYTIGVRRCNRELGHDGAHVCPHPDHEHLIHQQPAQAEPVSELARARELFDQAHDGSGVDKDYLWSSVGAILDHLEAERVLPQPPAAPGTPLTVDARARSLGVFADVLDRVSTACKQANAGERHDDPAYQRHFTCLAIENVARAVVLLADELERAQKGGGK